jgi:hypothetical protein
MTQNLKSSDFVLLSVLRSKQVESDSFSSENMNPIAHKESVHRYVSGKESTTTFETNDSVYQENISMNSEEIEFNDDSKGVVQKMEYQNESMLSPGAQPTVHHLLIAAKSLRAISNGIYIEGSDYMYQDRQNQSLHPKKGLTPFFSCAGGYMTLNDGPQASQWLRDANEQSFLKAVLPPSTSASRSQPTSSSWSKASSISSLSITDTHHTSSKQAMCSIPEGVSIDLFEPAFCSGSRQNKRHTTGVDNFERKKWKAARKKARAGAEDSGYESGTSSAGSLDVEVSMLVWG